MALGGSLAAAQPKRDEGTFMTVVISKVRVPDYAQWAARFEAGAESRRSFGLKTLAYGQDRAAEGVVFIILEVQSDALARKLLDNPTLLKNVEEQGVERLDLVFLDP
jgi:hypothetical protein